jgi:WD40 repeat protein
MQSDAVDVLEGHKTTVLYCRISPNGKWIASVSHDNTMRIWNAQARQCIAVFHADGALFACDFHPQDDRIIAVGQRGIYYLQMLW